MRHPDLLVSAVVVALPPALAFTYILYKVLRHTSEAVVWSFLLCCAFCVCIESQTPLTICMVHVKPLRNACTEELVGKDSNWQQSWSVKHRSRRLMAALLMFAQASINYGDGLTSWEIL